MNKETKNKTKKHPDPFAVIAGIILFFLGLFSLFGWWKLEALYFTIPLYIIATFFISFGAFGIIYEFTAGSGARVDRSDYAVVIN